MAAPKGNQFWKARSSHGRNPIFAMPDELWAACCEYFEWVEANPLYESKPFAYQGEVTIATLPKMRAMTLDGLCTFLDIFGVTTRVERIIRDQKFAGAAADLLNANIIARDLGLADKSELTGKDGKDLIPEAKSDRDMAREIAFALAAGRLGDKGGE